MFYIIAVAIIISDQIVKYAAMKWLKPIGSVPVIEGVFHFTYVENQGAAFGILQNQRWVFIIIGIVMCILMIWYFAKHPQEPLIMKISGAMLLGGAIGNLIDRVRFGYVVDMLHFKLIDFPVFNIADSGVTVGTTLMVIAVLFFGGLSALLEKTDA